MPAITVPQQTLMTFSSIERAKQCRSLPLSSLPSSLSWSCQIYATRPDFFVSVIIDLRPSRAIHCPDLNVCLINESRSQQEQVDCRTIHFGYAIPINIVPVHDSSELVELVLDQSAELNDQIVNFLFDHYSQLDRRRRRLCYGMAATAKHDLRRKFPTSTASSSATTPSGEEDIAAIAKQISDHAEAIYQTWKSRGLAPTEILTCHSNVTAVDKFGSALTPCNSSVAIGNNTGNKGSSSSLSLGCSSTAVDILTQTPNLDNSNLEKLVNNFVVEDKARMAASKQKSPSRPLPSSIQFALQKFERKFVPQQQQQMTVSAKNNIIISDDTKRSTDMLISPITSSFSNKPSQIAKPQISTKARGSHHCEVLLETIETTFPDDLSPKKAMQQKRPASTLIASSSTTSSLNVSNSSHLNSGLTTWPLKNKLNDIKKITDVSSSTKTQLRQENIVNILLTKDKERSDVTGTNSQCTYLEEVAREEERLINALKTGSVLTEEPERITACARDRQKPIIKREKPKIELVKQIIIGTHNHGINSMGNVANISNIATSAVIDQIPLINKTKPFSKDDLSAMSTVNYAKIKYQAAQQNMPMQQLEEQRVTSDHSYSSISEQLVSNTKTRYEMEIRKNKDTKNLDIKNPVTSRWGPRIVSPRPRLEQAVPHPELTSQQRQHIRAAAAATVTGNNPVRPFLTRGSVAERVLIFEKCPSELLLDKRGTRQSAINTWRNNHEVQNKAQVINKYNNIARNIYIYINIIINII
jgi:serine/threonine-protein phosphatase 2A regulatory subunit B''